MTPIPNVAREQHAAWQRARSAEDLQVGWVSSIRLLEAALDGDLDALLLQKFGARVRRLADQVGGLEPVLVAIGSPRLAFWTAMYVAAEVLIARHEHDRIGELLPVLASLEELQPEAEA